MRPLDSQNIYAKQQAMYKPYLISKDRLANRCVNHVVASANSNIDGVPKRLFLKVDLLESRAQYILVSGVEEVETFNLDEFDEAIEAYNRI